MVATHKHHIIPKHMGGSDEPSNLVELTIEQHAEAHRILYEQYGKWQDKIAYDMLSGQISVADAIKETQRQYMTNRVISEDTLERMSKSQKERMKNGGHPMLGKTFSAESRKKMSDSHKGQVPVNKGVPKTLEQIEKDRLAQMKVPHYECHICGKMCRGKGNLKQHLNKHIPKEV